MDEEINCKSVLITPHRLRNRRCLNKRVVPKTSWGKGGLKLGFFIITCVG